MSRVLRLLPEEIPSQDASLLRESARVFPYGALDPDWDLAIHLIDEYEDLEDHEECYPERPRDPS